MIEKPMPDERLTCCPQVAAGNRRHLTCPQYVHSAWPTPASIPSIGEICLLGTGQFWARLKAVMIREGQVEWSVWSVWLARTRRSSSRGQA